MEAINCLFIGGVKDGMWMAIEEWKEEVRVPVRISANSLMRVGEMPMAMGEIKTEVYRAMRFAGEKARFTVYALEGMTGDDALTALITGYKKT